tara:strand:- start:568 stop:786 length:219 start_codon:yes stop_codon:yes gene_type:complete
MKKFDPKTATRVVGFRIPYKEFQTLERIYTASSYKKKVDFMREIFRRGLDSLLTDNSALKQAELDDSCETLN